MASWQRGPSSPRHRLQRCRGPCMQSHNCDILRSPPEMGEGRGCPKNGPEHYVHLGRHPVRRTPARPMTLCQPTPPAHPTWASEQDWSPKNVWGFFGTGRRKTSGGFCAVAPRHAAAHKKDGPEPELRTACATGLCQSLGNHYHANTRNCTTIPMPCEALPCRHHAAASRSSTRPRFRITRPTHHNSFQFITVASEKHRSAYDSPTSALPDHALPPQFRVRPHCAVPSLAPAAPGHTRPRNAHASRPRTVRCRAAAPIPAKRYHSRGMPH